MTGSADESPESPRALITGASRGIGLAIARALAPDHRLVLVARSLASLERAHQSLAKHQPDVDLELYPCDLADPDARRALCASVESMQIDVLVNNAGIAPTAPIHRTEDHTWADVMAINLTAPFELTRAVLPHMRTTGWGRIVNVASTAALKGYRYTAAYCASKHGLLGLTRGTALDVADKGITVNAVCPGFTETDLVSTAVDNIMEKTGRSSAQARAALAAGNPQGRLIEPHEVAAMVRFLVGPGAGSVHGQAMAIDGGETA